jgi:hypothetical protein
MTWREIPAMDTTQRHRFDHDGYLVLRGFLAEHEVRRLHRAVERLEESVLPLLVEEPWHRGAFGQTYRHDPQRGLLVSGAQGAGRTVVIEDFWNADAEFSLLLDHAPTLAIARAAIRGRIGINNSEVRVRHAGNHTGAHMGGPLSQKYMYRHDGAGFDCAMVRFIYFTQRVRAADGAFCVIPGSHKDACAPVPGALPEDEPGMVPLEVEPGDVVFFTENLRHGGFVNRGPQVRRTLHVGYGPCWMRSQNAGTLDDPPYLTASTWARLTPAQRDLFLIHPEADPCSRLPPGSRAPELAAV